MKNKWLALLLILVAIKGIVWMMLTPIFQAPDENVHFGMIQYLGENRQHPGKVKGEITSAELLKVAEIVNFNFVASHPVWQGLPDDWLSQINSIDPQLKQEFLLAQGGQKLPQLYFWSMYPVYRILIEHSFLVRLMSLRVISVFFSLGVAYLTLLSAKIFFKPKLSLAVAALVAFQPMYSSISAAVSYDTLAILIGSLFIYTGLRYLKTKHLFLLLSSLALSLIGIFVKTQLIGLLLAWPFLLGKKQLKYLFFMFLLLIPISRLNVFSQLLSIDPVSPIKYLTSSYQALYAEVFPWYWGVFGWLEKTMPLVIYRILKIITALTIVGLLIKKPTRATLWLIIVSLTVAGVVFVNDYMIFSQRGSGFGVQGRYFLPAISAHMILLVLGLKNIFKQKEKLLTFSLIIGSVALNLTAIYSLYQFFGWHW